MPNLGLIVLLVEFLALFLEENNDLKTLVLFCMDEPFLAKAVLALIYPIVIGF